MKKSPKKFKVVRAWALFENGKFQGAEPSKTRWVDILRPKLVQVEIRRKG